MPGGSPQLSAAMLEFTPVDERVASLGPGGETLTVVCAYAPNRSLEYSAFLETLNGVLCQHCGQRWRYLEGRDWEERPP